MGDGSRLAIAIVILFLSMVAFFFAFHPGGVALNGSPIKNPGDILQFLFGQFDAASGSKDSTPAATPATTGTGKTGVAPGTTHIGVQGGP